MPFMVRVSVGVATVAVVLAPGGRRACSSAPLPRPARRRRRRIPRTPGTNTRRWGFTSGPAVRSRRTPIIASPSDLLFYMSLRATYDLKPQWAGGLTIREWLRPGRTARRCSAPSRAGSPRATTSTACSSTPRWGRRRRNSRGRSASTWAAAWSGISGRAGFAIGLFLRYGAVINADSRTGADGCRGALADRFRITSAARRPALAPAPDHAGRAAARTRQRARHGSRRHRRRSGSVPRSAAGQTSLSVPPRLPRGRRRWRRHPRCR